MLGFFEKNGKLHHFPKDIGQVKVIIPEVEYTEDGEDRTGELHITVTYEGIIYDLVRPTEDGGREVVATRSTEHSFIADSLTRDD
jgi:hypothetical protein